MKPAVQCMTLGCFLMLACLLLSGCSSGPKLIPVDGLVTVGGKPAEGAVIMFHPEDVKLPTGSAVAGSDGSFKPVTDSKPGLMTGKYVVTVTWPDPSKKPTEAQIMMGTAELGPDLLKGKYATKKNSSLNIEIIDGMTAIAPFEL